MQDICLLCEPKKVHICDGSEKEIDSLQGLLEKQGAWIRLKKRKGCWYARSHPSDVARLEKVTYICSLQKEGAGPTNNWYDPKKMRLYLHRLFRKCMKGRVMYVIPYLMGPEHSPYARLGLEITDSAYVVCNMFLMTLITRKVLTQIQSGKPFVFGVHSVGMPLKRGEKDSFWPCNREKCIAHFPETKEIWSFGSGYGGNALLGKKCFALRIASKMGQEEGWLAEHMLLLGLTNPKGKKKYFAAAFPSGCGKTNLAMLQSTLPGWKVECLGDDIAWMHFGSEGKLYAINPERGFFGMAVGTSMHSNPYALQAIERDTIFTNVALTKDREDVWWEGMTQEVPKELIDWKGKVWERGSLEKASHPNARFTVSIRRCPILDKAFDDPNGVWVEAILFGGRRASLTPLVLQSFNWEEGVLMGACLSSEKTAASDHADALRHDPFAMVPFCGYHMGEYFQNWLNCDRPGRHLPKIFSVNWFRKGHDGKWLWPGYGENIRVLKWIFERLEGQIERVETPVGWTPFQAEGPFQNKELFEIDRNRYLEEIDRLKVYFSQFQKTFPEALWTGLSLWEDRLKAYTH